MSSIGKFQPIVGSSDPKALFQDLSAPLIRQVYSFLEGPNAFFSACTVCKAWNQGNAEVTAARTQKIRDEILPSLPSPRGQSLKKVLGREIQTVRFATSTWTPTIQSLKLKSDQCCFTVFKNRVFIGVGSNIEIRNTKNNKVETTIKALTHVARFTRIEAIDERQIAVACQLKDQRNMLYVIDLVAQKITSQHECDVSTMKAYKGVLYFGSKQGDVSYLNSSRKVSLFSRSKNGAVRALGISDKCLLVSHNEGRARVYDRTSKTPEQLINSLPSVGSINEIYHLEKDLFVWGNIQKEIFVQDIKKEKAEFRLLPMQKKEDSAGITLITGNHRFAHFRNILFTLNTNALRVFDLSKRTHLHTLKIEGRKEMHFGDGKLYILVQKIGEMSQLLVFNFASARARTPSPTNV